MPKIGTLFLCTLTFIGGPAYLRAETVLALEYHLVLTVDDKQYQARNTTQAQDPSVIPIEFQDYRVDLHISSFDSDKYKILILLFERVDDAWVRMDADPGGFGGRIGEFHTFDWNGDDSRLGIAVIVTTASNEKVGRKDA